MANPTTEPVILPWAEMSKKAERDGVDIMDYVNSMNAHVLHQKQELAKLNRKIDSLRAALQEIAMHRLHPTDRIAHEALAGKPIDVELYARVESGT